MCNCRSLASLGMTCKSYMSLWACLLLPSLPLDVFARAQAPSDAAHPFVVGSGGHYPRVVAANAAARDAGIRDEPARVERAGARPRSRFARSRRRCRSARARAARDLGADVHADGMPRAAQRGGRRDRREPPPVRRLAAARRAPGRWRARAGLRESPRPRAHAGGCAAARARRPHVHAVVERARLPDVLAPLPLTLVDLDERPAPRCATPASRPSDRPPPCRATVSPAASVLRWSISSIARSASPPMRARRSCRRRASKAGSTCPRPCMRWRR